MNYNSSQEKKKLIKLAERVLEKRYQILISSTFESKLQIFEIQKIKDGFIKNLQQLEKMSYDVLMFQVSLIIDGTKCFEAFSLNQNGQRRFKYSKEILQITIEKNSSSIRKALFHKVIIKPFQNQHAIDQAVQNIRQNYLITKLIAGKEFTREKLDEFLSFQEYKVFEQPTHKYTQFIQGLSSFDGRIVYIYQTFDGLDNIYVEPKFEIERISRKMFNDMYLTLVWLIEYQIIENLSKWTSNSNVLSISPERNQNLRIENDQMIGSGNFYLTKAHKYKTKLYNPFQLNYIIWTIMNRVIVKDY